MLLRRFLSVLLAAGLATAAKAADPVISGPVEAGTEKGTPGSALDAAGVQLSAAHSEYQIKTQRFVLRGGVLITTPQGRISCDYAEIDTENLEFVARGNIVAKGKAPAADATKLNGQGIAVPQDFEVKAEEASGNLRTRLFRVGANAINATPWYSLGSEAQTLPNGSMEARGVVLTTCDNLCKGLPTHYHLVADRLVISQEGDITAYGVKFYAGTVPFFYLPWMTSDLDVGDGDFIVRGGMGSRTGPFVTVSRKFKLWRSGPMKGTAFVDTGYFARQGPGAGVRLDLESPKHFTKAQGYWLPYAEMKGSGDWYGRFSRTNDDDGRWNGEVFQKYEITPELSWRLHLDAESDIAFRRDFRMLNTRRDYESAVNYGDLEYMTPAWSLSLNASPRLARWEAAVERLPELRFDLPRLRLGDSPFLYTSRNSIADLSARWRQFDKPIAASMEVADYDSVRLDTTHVLYSEFDALGLKWVPRAGFRILHYSDSSKNEVTGAELSSLFAANDPFREPKSALSNYDSDGGSMTRGAIELGYEASTKFYNSWMDAYNKTLGVDGLRHVVQPYVNHNFIPVVSGDRDNVHYYDANDRLIAQHWLRSGVQQRLETRRDGNIHSLVTLDNYVDFHFDSKEGEEGFGDFGTRIEYIPSTWLKFDSDILADSKTGKINFFSAGMHVGTVDTLQASLTWIRRNDFVSRDLQSFGSTVNSAGLVSSWARRYDAGDYLRAVLRKRLWDENFVEVGTQLDLQDGRAIANWIEFQRQLHCWTGGVRYEVRPDEWLFMFMLYLNAYPKAGANVKLGL